MLILLLKQIDIVTIYYITLVLLLIAKLKREFYNGRKGYNREET